MGCRLKTLILMLMFLWFIPCGQASAQPQVEVLASGLRHPVGIAVASDGKVYFSEFGVEGSLSVYLPEEQIVEAAIPGLVSPAAVALAPNGIVYVAESAEGRLWSYNPKTGESEIIAEAIQGIWGLAVGVDGTIYLSIKGIPSQENPEGGKILKLLEGGKTETLVSGLYVPYGLDVAPNGDIYFIEFGTLSEVSGTLKVLRAATGQVETLLEGLAWPYDVAAAEDGTIYFTVKAGKIYAFKEAGEPELLAEGFQRLYGIALDPQGENLYFTEFGSPVARDRGDGTLRRISLKEAPEVTETTATQTVTATVTKTVTATVTITPSLSETVEDLKGVVEALVGSLQTISLMVWVTLAVSMIAVAAAVIALLLTLRFPRAGLKRKAKA